jgi:hypothetical protein
MKGFRLDDPVIAEAMRKVEHATADVIAARELRDECPSYDSALIVQRAVKAREVLQADLPRLRSIQGGKT